MLVRSYSCQYWSHATPISCVLNLVLCTALISLYKGQQPLLLHSTTICRAVDTISMPTTKAIVASDDSETNFNEDVVQSNLNEDVVENKEINVGSTSGVRPASMDGIINLDHGDPTMYEEFWKGTGDKGNIMIPGWNTMSYFSDVSNLCWFLEPEYANQIKRLHKLVGNAVTDDYYIIVGTGSTQLLQAALFALSPPDAAEPMSVVSGVPWYSSYPSVTDFLKSNLFRWAGDASHFKGENYVELVCTPNNPDGSIRKAVLNSKFGRTIHDLAYYWPQYTPITGAAKHDIMLFTVSKCTTSL